MFVSNGFTRVTTGSHNLEQAVHSDCDQGGRVDPESLDENFLKFAQGEVLTTLHGDVDEHLPNAIELPMAPKRQHGQVGNNNNRKSDEKFFVPYTWATDAKPAAESEEDLKELRMQHRKLQLAKRAYKVGSRKDKAEELLRIIKAKINDAVMRFSSSGTKTGDAQRGRAVWHAIHAGLGLQYADCDDDEKLKLEDRQGRTHKRAEINKHVCGICRCAECNGTSCNPYDFIHNKRLCRSHQSVNLEVSV